MKERNKLVKILTNPHEKCANRNNKSKSLYTPQPIEQLIFDRNLLKVFGYAKYPAQKFRKFNFSDLETTKEISSPMKETSFLRELKRDYSTKSNVEKKTSSKKDSIGQRCNTTNNRFFINNTRPKSTLYRVIESQNDRQKQRYEMLHLNFIRLQKQYQNIYGIPLSELFLQHQFLTLINQQLLIIVLGAFNIDCTNIYEVITYSKYKQFKQVIIWKDNTIMEQVNVITKIFENVTGGDLLNIIHLISLIQPYKILDKKKVNRDMEQINRLVYDLENKCIEYVLQQGNLSALIDLDKLKELFLTKILDINNFIDLLTGQF